ncbi:acetyl-CoA carboxylase biotin carboxylase subunit [Loigolactobacillus rennini]|uniref:biotin carboxylase n=1 Tax=Loigolactobacillus rennini DSM 20253 TaxID=1423796 RepID=A0A0R2D6W4_9LACO|nr:biotin carboxylase N-terminal domain-containing protein [Loigolactobacillus rennini]KRM99791.1 acetyl-CoA carboxylase subunit A [Loigolactobacillus rennini DSM 20253]
MFRKILIANRGEVALRIIRACQQLKIATVAVYAQAEQHSLFVQQADEAYCVGPDTAQSSYLNREGILMTALLSGADAIHPGYGFLAEDAVFAQMCAECGLTFIGPKASVIELLADKAAAKKFARQQGVPVIPGGMQLKNEQDLRTKAKQLGYPVMLKANFGGGGKGMRVLASDHELRHQYHLIQEEARQAFLNDAVYLEKYLPHARHIEVQILQDHNGHLQILGDRECSLQRHHQKVVEESPAAILQPQQRQTLYQLAQRLMAGLAYTGLGTLEFLFTGQQFYFLEMNTRLQVEHAVTEMTTGADLVTTQIQVAAGKTVQPKIATFKGHAIEVRLNAQPQENLLATGQLTKFRLFTGARVETGYREGDQILPYYDALIAKILVKQPTRLQAVTKMQCCLQRVQISGIGTNLPLLKQIMGLPSYRANLVDIHFLAHLVGDAQ